MHIKVAELWLEPPIEDILYPKVESDLGSATILYIPLARYTDIDVLDDTVYQNIDSYTRRLADIIIFRTHRTEAEKFFRNTRLIKNLQHRLENRPIMILSWDARQYNFVPLVPSTLSV